MNIQQRILFLERAVRCLRCSQQPNPIFDGVEPTFTNLTLEDIGATSESTPEEIQQLLADYIKEHPITIGSNEIRYIQIDGATYVIQNQGPGEIEDVDPKDIIPIGSSTKETQTTLDEVTLEGNVLTVKYTGESGEQQSKSVSLQGLITKDVNLEDASYDAAQYILTLRETDGQEFKIDLSEFSIASYLDWEGNVRVIQEHQEKFTISKAGQTGDFGDLKNIPSLVTNADLEAEIQARKDGDTKLQTTLETEIQDRKNSDSNLQTALDIEIQARKDSDNNLSEKIQSETQRAKSAEEANTNAIATETKERKDADTALNSSIQNNTQSIQNEVTRAKVAEAANAVAITTETQERKSADTTLQTAISNEATTRATEDNKKLDKTTTTISSPDAANKYVYLTTEDNSAPKRMLAGDLGKNIANSSLTSVSGAGMTLGAAYNWDTKGFPFNILGLPDKSADSTFVNLLVENTSGQVAKSNGKEIFKLFPTLLSTAEKDSYATSWGGQYLLKGSFAVYGVISPPINVNSNSTSYIVLEGLNMNVDPNLTNVWFLDKTKPLKDSSGKIIYSNLIPTLGFSRFDDGKQMIISKEAKLLPKGEYNIFIESVRGGIPFNYLTDGYVIVTDTVTPLSLNGLKWKIARPSDTTTANTSASQNTAYLTTETGTSATNVIAAVLSDKVLIGDFYIKINMSDFTWHGPSVSPKTIFGLSVQTDVILADLSNVSFSYSSAGNNAANQGNVTYFNNVQTFVPTGNTKITSAYVIFIRRGSSIYAIVNNNNSQFVFSKSDSITTEPLAFFGAAANWANKLPLTVNIQEIYLF